MFRRIWNCSLVRSAHIINHCFLKVSTIGALEGVTRCYGSGFETCFLCCRSVRICSPRSLCACSGRQAAGFYAIHLLVPRWHALSSCPLLSRPVASTLPFRSSAAHHISPNLLTTNEVPLLARPLGRAISGIKDHIDPPHAP